MGYHFEGIDTRIRREVGRALEWLHDGLPGFGDGIPVEHPKYPMIYPAGNLLFLDEVGCIVPAERVYACYRALGLDWRTWPVHRMRSCPHVFRRGPVPGTGNRRGRWTSYFRAPATFQELRRNEADRIDGVLNVRAARRSVDLDIDFDDKPRGRRSRGWKENRNTQWR